MSFDQQQIQKIKINCFNDFYANGGKEEIIFNFLLSDLSRAQPNFFTRDVISRFSLVKEKNGSHQIGWRVNDKALVYFLEQAEADLIFKRTSFYVLAAISNLLINKYHSCYLNLKSGTITKACFSSELNYLESKFKLDVLMSRSDEEICGYINQRPEELNDISKFTLIIGANSLTSIHTLTWLKNELTKKVQTDSANLSRLYAYLVFVEAQIDIRLGTLGKSTVK